MNKGIRRVPNPKSTIENVEQTIQDWFAIFYGCESVCSTGAAIQSGDLSAAFVVPVGRESQGLPQIGVSCTAKQK